MSTTDDTASASLEARAHALLQMHRPGRTLVLPTVWDAWSAGAAVEAGFPALTVGSHPVAASRGVPDNEGLTFGEALAGIRRITRSVSVPVSADVESGYGLAADELVERVLDAGAVGINVEDTVHGEGGRVRAVQEHADYIGGIRAAADAAGVELVINARTDVYVHGTEVFEDPLREAIARLRACEKAGARSLYPVRVPDAGSLRTLLGAVTLPVNITAHPVSGGLPGSLDELRRLGVRRITFGPYLQQALAASIKELLQPWGHGTGAQAAGL